MRLRGRNHRASAAVRSFTVAVIAAATFAQLLALSHEMTVRHFRCAEHGELTHVAAVASGGVVEAPSRRAESSFRAHDADAPDAHEHCSLAFTVEGSSCAPSTAGVAVGTVEPPPALNPTAPAISSPGRTFVLASAPKTSPPSA